MKTATVRDLRNRFAAVAKWIEEGEQVTITRHGGAFATLSPAAPKPSGSLDWTKRLAQRNAIGKRISKRETEAFWKALRD
jgi:antitoxin (DNA-binding transcriptional repressor) of toxin-antitoxin stability system